MYSLERKEMSRFIFLFIGWVFFLQNASYLLSLFLKSLQKQNLSLTFSYSLDGDNVSQLLSLVYVVSCVERSSSRHLTSVAERRTSVSGLILAMALDVSA